MAGRDLRKASSLARKIKGKALQLDVRDTPSIETALKPFRRIDLFVNCAGVSREETLDEVSEAAWDEVLDTNLKAAMFLAQAVAPPPEARRQAGAAAFGARAARPARPRLLDVLR